MEARRLGRGSSSSPPPPPPPSFTKKRCVAVCTYALALASIIWALTATRRLDVLSTTTTDQFSAPQGTSARGGAPMSSSSWIDLPAMHSGDEFLRRLTAVVRSRGVGDNGHNNNNNNTSCTIDILSIGSRTLPHLQKAQNSTWATHPSRRLFIAANELVDPDPNCSVNATFKDAFAVTSRCKGSPGKKFWNRVGARNWLTDHWTAKFARNEWLQKKKNPGGWMCAQRRFTAALSKLIRLYREAAAAAEGAGLDPASVFPDYLILGDDDTSVDLRYISEKLCHRPKERMQQQGQQGSDVTKILEPQPPNVPTVYAGCLVRAAPVQTIQFSFPYGGFGTFFSRGALERFATPLHCDDDDDAASSGNATEIDAPAPSASLPSTALSSASWSSSFVKEACVRLSPSTPIHAGERSLFTPGMSVSDLMGAFTASDNHFCVHSDWAVGYFVNFYNISRHTPIGDGDFHHEFDKHISNGRMFALDGSLSYKKPENYCGNDNVDSCRKNPNRVVCHRLSPEDMADIYNYSRVDGTLRV